LVADDRRKVSITLNGVVDLRRFTFERLRLGHGAVIGKETFRLPATTDGRGSSPPFTGQEALAVRHHRQIARYHFAVAEQLT
jgi:hypothetical protein